MTKVFNGKIFYACIECDRLIAVQDFLEAKDTSLEWVEKDGLYLCPNCKQS